VELYCILVLTYGVGCGRIRS